VDQVDAGSGRYPERPRPAEEHAAIRHDTRGFDDQSPAMSDEFAASSHIERGHKYIPT
jgi:hypothetical protein